MAQKVHVPKFGNWDCENIPYTACFENARKEKGSGHNQNNSEENLDVRKDEGSRFKIFNPNDPEENPDAFRIGYGNQHQTNNSNNGTVNADLVFKGNMETPVHRPVVYHKTLNQNRSGYHGQTKNETSNDEDKFDQTVPSYYQRRRTSRNSIDGSYVYSLSPSTSPSPSPSSSPSIKSATMTGKTGLGKALHHRFPSVPKFGDWDKNDRKSAEGFTLIFDKVKEEKITAASYPAVHTGVMTNPNKLKFRRFIFSRLKILGCLCSASHRRSSCMQT